MKDVRYIVGLVQAGHPEFASWHGEPRFSIIRQAGAMNADGEIDPDTAAYEIVVGAITTEQLIGLVKGGIDQIAQLVPPTIPGSEG